MELLVEQKRRVLRIVLNRPEKRNALTTAMCAGIVEAVMTVQDKDDVGAILLSANGSVFCSGMDLDEAALIDQEQLAAIHQRLFSLHTVSLKPLVICVNGAAMGGGLGLIAQGHIVTASSSAVFALREIHVGLWPFMVYHSLETALGARRLLELSLTGRTFAAQEALDWGFVHSVCNPAETLDRAKGLAGDLAKASPAALKAGMQYFQRTREKSGSEAAEIAKALRYELMESDDFKEGREAFKYKRVPRWPSMPQDFYSVPYHFDSDE